MAPPPPYTPHTFLNSLLVFLHVANDSKQNAWPLPIWYKYSLRQGKRYISAQRVRSLIGLAAVYKYWYREWTSLSYPGRYCNGSPWATPPPPNCFHYPLQLICRLASARTVKNIDKYEPKTGANTKSLSCYSV